MIQRKKLSDKGGKDCDVLVMSATPIPRTMMMTIYGDMDISLIKSNQKIGIKLKHIVKMKKLMKLLILLK